MRYIACFVITLITFYLHGQNIEHYIQKNYTIENGLPSNECYAAVQDSLGYIWIATDRGLSRFDGYGFKNYGIAEGLQELSCLQMQMDEVGIIWLRTYANRLYKYLPRQDTIVAYAFNDKIIDEIKNSEVLDFYASRDTLYISAINHGIIKIDKKGNIYLHKNKLREPYFSFLQINDKILSYDYDKLAINAFENVYNSQVYRKTKLYFSKNIIKIKYPNRIKNYNPNFGVKINKNQILYANQGSAYIFKNSVLDTVFDIRSLKDLKILENGDVLIGELYEGGLRKYKTLKEIGSDYFNIIIPKVSVSNILIGKDNNIFVTTLEDGLFILKPSDIITVNNPSLLGQEIINLQTKNTSQVYLNINQNSVIDFDLKTNREKHSELLFDEKLFHIYFDFINNLKFYSNFPISYLTTKNKKKYFFESDIQNFLSKRVKLLKNGQHLVITSTGIKTYKNLNHNPIFETYPAIYRLDVIDALDFGDDFLIGGRDGLYVLKGYHKIKLDSIHPFFNTRINSIERHGGIYYLGSLGGGLGIWDGKDSVKVLTTKEGLISNNIEKVVTDSLNTLILCTKSGISEISLRDSLSIKNYTTKHGLPSNQVNDALFINDTLLLATSKGLAYMSGKARYIPPKMPIIESFKVNNQFMSSLSNIKLSHNQNDLFIAYKALDYSQDGNVTYSYSLDNKQWYTTSETQVNLASLKPGKYIFSVRAANRDGQWSPSTVLPFQITAPFWMRLWFWPLMILVGIAIIYLYYTQRIKDINAKNETQKEIVKLERAALKAQMNPHFIFNCLNSIQSYIIQNDKDKAMEYLSRFAKLIRQYLNASAHESISLDHEIDLLDNYLYLEQIRFNHSFSYHFSIDDTLIMEDIYLPAMLIQPIVENAVVHGMKEKKIGGLIKIRMTKEDEMLIVAVSDNGQGVKNDNKNKHQKSFGAAITQKRLEHINKFKDNYTIHSSLNGEGTEVTIRIKLS